MTRRERLERKIERRREWAENAQHQADVRIGTAQRMAEGIPFGQPILVGHHSERRDRNYRARIEGNFEKGFEAMNRAQHHDSKAAGLEAQLERTIFSDDADAVGQLERKAAGLEAQRDRMKRVNALYRKGDADGLAALGLNLEHLRAQVARVGLSFVKVPYEGYQLTNLGARIRDIRKRIDDIKARTARSAQAEAVGGVLIERSGEHCRVTFAEKPDRDVLTALKSAGFRWGAGHWSGRTDQLPENLKGA